MDPREVERFRRGLARVSPRQGRFERALRAFIGLVCRLLGWRVEAAGLARVPAEGARLPAAGCLVVVAPHRAWIDPFLVVAAWPPEAAHLVWVGDGRTMARSWWRRRFLPRIGTIPVGPGLGGPRAYAELAAGALSRGAAIVVFPEKGPPSDPSRTRTIAPGFAYLALRSGAPVIPVVLGGTHRILRDVTFTLDVLEPIAVGQTTPDPFRPEHRSRVRLILESYEASVAQVLPGRTALADARRPRRERWAWLGRLFH